MVVPNLPLTEIKHMFEGIQVEQGKKEQCLKEHHEKQSWMCRISDQSSLSQNPDVKFSCSAGGLSRQLWFWGGRWGKWAHTLPRTLTFTMFLPNSLDLYFQLLMLIVAVSTDDSMRCCSGLAAGYAGDMEGWERNVKVTHVSQNKKGLLS